MNQSTSTVLIACVVGIGVGFALGWSLKSETRAPVDDVALDDESSPGEPENLFGLDSPTARENRLVTELEDSRAAVSALTIERDTLRERLTTLEPEGDGTGGGSGGAAAADATPPHFVLAGTGKALSGVDWKTTGTSLAKMTPMIAEILESLARGSRDKMHLQGRITQLNQPLTAEAIKIAGRGGLSGGGVNGVFTHPAVQINFVHSTLVEAGLPLDENQETRLLSIGDRYLDDERARPIHYDETTYEMEKLIDETRLKSRFFAEVDAILTPEQVNALHPEIVRGRVQADLFSAGLLWPMKVQVTPFESRADLATKIAEGAMARLSIPIEHAGILGELAHEWAMGFSDAVLAYQADELDKLGLVRVNRILEVAPLALAFLQGVVNRVPLDEETQAVIRATSAVVLPQN